MSKEGKDFVQFSQHLSNLTLKKRQSNDNIINHSHDNKIQKTSNEGKTDLEKLLSQLKTQSTNLQSSHQKSLHKSSSVVSLTPSIKLDDVNKSINLNSKLNIKPVIPCVVINDDLDITLKDNNESGLTKENEKRISKGKGGDGLGSSNYEAENIAKLMNSNQQVYRPKEFENKKCYIGLTLKKQQKEEIDEDIVRIKENEESNEKKNMSSTEKKVEKYEESPQKKKELSPIKKNHGALPQKPLIEEIKDDDEGFNLQGSVSKSKSIKKSPSIQKVQEIKDDVNNNKLKEIQSDLEINEKKKYDSPTKKVIEKEDKEKINKTKSILKNSNSSVKEAEKEDKVIVNSFFPISPTPAPKTVKTPIKEQKQHEQPHQQPQQQDQEIKVKEEVSPIKEEKKIETLNEIIQEDYEEIPEICSVKMTPAIKKEEIPSKSKTITNKETMTKNTDKLQKQTKEDTTSENQDPDITIIQNDTKEKIKKAQTTQPKPSQLPNHSTIVDNDPQTVAMNIIQKMKDFDITNPDLTTKDYSFLNSYESTEQYLPDLIDKFQQAIILTEGTEIFRQRRNTFLHNQAFIRHTIATEYKTHLSTYLQKICSSYSETLFKVNHINKSVDLSKSTSSISTKSLFVKQKNHYSFSIGEIEDICTFVYKYSLNLYVPLIKSAVSSFSSWRQVKSDGNSFYRVFIFALIEQFILKNQADYIEVLSSEIKQQASFFNQKKIDYEKAINVLQLIKDELSKGKTKKAYDILIIAFNQTKQDSFGQTLIFYLKKIAYDFLMKTYQVMEEEDRKNCSKINKEIIISLEAIIEDNIEPEYPVIAMIQYLFNLEIEIFWIDGDFDHPKHGTLLFENKTKIDIMRITPDKIKIAYFFSSYYIIYPHQKDIESDVLKEELGNSITSFTQLTFIEKDKANCSRCGRLSSKIFFLDKGFSTCLECLKEYINYVFNQRARMFIKYNFIGVEYYARNIQLSQNVFLSNYEFIEINNHSTFQDLLLDKVKGICFECSNFINQDKRNTPRNELKCRCCYCNDCLTNKQNKATNGLIILNAYEKFKYEPIVCRCYHKFDPDDAARFFEGVDNEDYEEAIKRQYNYINSMCLVCEKKMVAENMLKFHYFDIKKEKGEPDSDDENDNENNNETRLQMKSIAHMICSSCYRIEKQKEKNDESNPSYRNRKNKDAVKSIFCALCHRKHYVGADIWYKEDDGACCSPNCLIF